MMKMRLVGPADEVRELLHRLRKTSGIEVLQESRAYQDRYSTVYFRYYLDVEIKPEGKRQ